MCAGAPSAPSPIAAAKLEWHMGVCYPTGSRPSPHARAGFAVDLIASFPYSQVASTGVGSIFSLLKVPACDSTRHSRSVRWPARYTCLCRSPFAPTGTHRPSSCGTVHPPHAHGPPRAMANVLGRHLFAHDVHIGGLAACCTLRRLLLVSCRAPRVCVNAVPAARAKRTESHSAPCHAGLQSVGTRDVPICTTSRGWITTT